MSCYAQIPLGQSRHVKTRYVAHAFWHRKKSWRDVSVLHCATRMTRVYYVHAAIQHMCKCGAHSVTSLV